MKFEKFLEGQLKNEEFKKEYDALEPKYQIIREIIKARMEQNLTQKELAEKVGTAQANISKLENGNANPTLDFLIRVFTALGKDFKIIFS